MIDWKYDRCDFNDDSINVIDGEVILEPKYEVKNREFPVTYLGNVFNKATNIFFVFNTKN